MSVNEQYDLVIVGGGMVGSALATALAEQPLRIALVEPQPPASSVPAAGSPFEPRVSALTLASVNLLKHLEVWPVLSKERHCGFSHMQVWDADGTGHIEFDSATLGEPVMGYIVENSRLVRALFERLAGQQNLDLVTDSQVTQVTETNGMHSLTLADGRQLQASLVVAADGAHSRLRELAGIEHCQRDYRQKAIVTTVRCQQSHAFTAWQRFLSTGPLAFLPLQDDNGDDHYCSIVWSADNSLADELLALDDASFRTRLQHAFESRLGTIEEVDQRLAFPLYERHARAYFKPGMVLVGDAAHTIHPLAGQGVNLGFLDAAVLAEEIEHALKRGVALADESILIRYQRRRRLDNTLMLSLMQGFKSLFGANALSIRWARNMGLSAFNADPVLKGIILKQAMGLSGLDLPQRVKKTT